MLIRKRYSAVSYSCCDRRCVSLLPPTGRLSKLMKFPTRGYVDSIVAAKENSARFGYAISPNRELVALGNVCAQRLSYPVYSPPLCRYRQFLLQFPWCHRRRAILRRDHEKSSQCHCRRKKPNGVTLYFGHRNHHRIVLVAVLSLFAKGADVLLGLMCRGTNNYRFRLCSQVSSPW